MPRATPVRSRTQDPPHDAARHQMTAERRAWLTHWKERAITALPAMVPVSVKVAIRRAVETALAPYGPEDHNTEVQDLVIAVVREMTDQLTAETQAEERDLRKQKLLQCAEVWIDDVMLKHLPPELVGIPRSPKRRQVLITLRKQIRQTLSAELTGDEPLASVIQRMREEVATWAVGQNPQVDRRTLLLRLAPWALAAFAGGVAAASLSPDLKTAVRTGTRVLKEKLTPYKPGAKAAWEYSLAQLHQWAKDRYPQEPPKDTPP